MPLDSNAAEYANYVPAAVRRQIAQVDGLYAEPVPTTVVEEGAAPTAPAPAEPPAAQEPVAPPAPAATDWEQRYRSLQGKYDVEVGQVRQQNQQLVRSIENLERTVQQMAERPAEPKAEPKPTTVVEGLTDKDREEYGDDLINFLNRAMAPHLAQRDQEIERLRGQLGQTSQQIERTSQTTLQQAAMASLDGDPEMGRKVDLNGQLYSHWRVVNEDPSFVSWLQTPDPVFGAPRLGVLRDAFSKGNAAQMKAIFGAYAREQTVVGASPGASSSHTAAEPAQAPAATGRVPLETFAAPGRPSGSSPVGAPGDKRLWTQTEIGRFYRQVQQGHFNNNPAEKAALEADLVRAAMENRVLKR